MKIIFIVFAVLLLIIRLFSPFIAEFLNQLMGTNIVINSDSNFLITIIASIDTLASVYFIIYGWYSVAKKAVDIDVKV